MSLFILLGATYALLTPPFEASDELWHYPMIQHLGNGNSLPVQTFDPLQAGPWKQEASQPPLYYYVGALLTFWIDTSDMPQVRWLNPHVDNGVLTRDGNRNLAIHDPQVDPWQGTLLALRIVRFASVLMSAAAVYLTYLIGKEIAPHRPEIGLGAAALHAFTPMYLFISGAVNNDNLAVPLASLGLLLLIRMVTRPVETTRDNLCRAAWVGGVAGLAVLTKQGTIGLLPLAWGTFFIVGWQGTPFAPAWSGFFRQVGAALWSSLKLFALFLLPILVLAGWWYVRNLQLYSDLLGWNAFVAVLGQRETPASIAQLWDERWGFMLSYWGLFGGVNVPMWSWVYHLLNGLAVVGVAGLGLYAWRTLRRWHGLQSPEENRLLRFVRGSIRFVIDHFGLVVALLFSTAVVYGLIQWATTTWSSQGRLVFTAISTLNLLWVLGLAAWLPQPWQRRGILLLGSCLCLLAALSPFVFIRPTYAVPYDPQTYTPCIVEAVDGCTIAEDLFFGEGLQLLSYGIDADEVQPGEGVDVWLEWRVLRTFERDWSVFVHLVDPVLGVPIAQRDMYLAQGLRPTRLVQAGDRFVNRYHITLPPTAVAPAELQLVVGIYDFYTGERLPLADGSETLSLTTLPLRPAEGDVPNPVQVNFENRFELIGYALEPRSLAAGETLNVTLYYRPLASTTVDYTFFAQIVGGDTTRYASLDMGQPTSSWTPGAVQTLDMQLTLAPDTPPEVYPLRIGIYTVNAESGVDNLQRVTPDGRLTDDFLNLTPVRVSP